MYIVGNFPTNVIGTFRRFKAFLILTYATHFVDKREASCSRNGSINNRDLTGQRNKSVQKNTISRCGSIWTKPIIHWVEPGFEQLMRLEYRHGRDHRNRYMLFLTISDVQRGCVYSKNVTNIWTTVDGIYCTRMSHVKYA